MYTVPSINRNVLTSFTICIPSIYFSCLTSLDGVSNAILKSIGDNGNFCLAPDFIGIALSYSPFRIMLAIIHKALLLLC